MTNDKLAFEDLSNKIMVFLEISSKFIKISKWLQKKAAAMASEEILNVRFLEMKL